MSVRAEMSDDRLLESFNKNGPVPLDKVRLVESQAGVHFDDEYVSFLAENNGGEGLIGPNSYVILWRIEELLELNEAYEVVEYAPGLFLFGSDGGGDAYGFDVKSGAVVSVPFVGMDASLVNVIAPNFRGFLEALDAP